MQWLSFRVLLSAIAQVGHTRQDCDVTYISAVLQIRFHLSCSHAGDANQDWFVPLTLITDSSSTISAKTCEVVAGKSSSGRALSTSQHTKRHYWQHCTFSVPATIHGLDTAHKHPFLSQLGTTATCKGTCLFPVKHISYDCCTHKIQSHIQHAHIHI